MVVCVLGTNHAPVCACLTVHCAWLCGVMVCNLNFEEIKCASRTCVCCMHTRMCATQCARKCVCVCVCVGLKRAYSEQNSWGAFVLDCRAGNSWIRNSQSNANEFAKTVLLDRSRLRGQCISGPLYA